MPAPSSRWGPILPLCLQAACWVKGLQVSLGGPEIDSESFLRQVRRGPSPRAGQVLRDGAGSLVADTENL